jgi:DNA-binding SARP family transcriptional activator
VTTAEPTDQPPYRLYLLGGSSLIGPDGPVDAIVRDDHVIAVLALAATAPAGVATRESVAATAWPDLAAADGRAALEAAMLRLRSAVGPDLLRDADGALALDPAVVWCDVQAYRRHLAGGDRLAAAAEYQGPYLDRFHLAGAAGFNHWMHAQRDELALAFREMAAMLAGEAMISHDGQAAARWWTRLVDADPWNPRAAVQAMEGFEAMGALPAAMAVAEEYLNRTRKGLGREADPDIEARLARLRDVPVRRRRYRMTALIVVVVVVVAVLLLTR